MPGPAAFNPHPALALGPPLTDAEHEAAVERIRLYGKHDAIEVLDDQIVVGWTEYQACLQAEVVPTVTNIPTPPGRIEEYILRRNVPRDLTGLQRGCWAALAYRAMCKELGRERMRQGGKTKGKVGLEDPDPWAGSRWFEHAAKIVGTKPGCVRSVDRIRRHAPDVFQYIREGRITSLSDARKLVEELAWQHGTNAGDREPNPDAVADRALVLANYEAIKKSRPMIRLAHERRREKRIARLPSPVPTGSNYTLYHGPMEEMSGSIPDHSVDLVVADVVYGEEDAPRMSAEVARIATRILVDGGILALIPGQVGLDQVLDAVRREGLVLWRVGSLVFDPRGGRRLQAIQGTDCIDIDPVFFFSKSYPPRRSIARLGFHSGNVDKRFIYWQKSLEPMMDLVRSVVGAGALVVDLCMGSGTTGEAALRTGNRFVGIESDPNRYEISARRLAEVEAEISTEAQKEAAE